MKYWKRSLCFLLILGLLVISFAGIAFAYGYQIDIDAMKELEKESTFPVKVVEKKVVEECFDTEMLDNNTDALVFTILNDSEESILQIRVKYVAYNEEGVTVDIESSMMYVPSVGNSPEIYEIVSKEGETVEPDGTCVIAQAVNYGLFKGIRAMVQDYTLEDGTLVTNPDYANWENMAFGLASGNVTVLD